MLVQVVDTPREFNFVGTAAATTSTIELGTFDLSGCRNAGLAVRIHSATILTTGTVVVKAYPAWPWEGAQQTQFADSSAVGTVSFDAGYQATTGGFKSAALSSMSSPAVRLTVEGTQPSSAGALKAVLTVGLELYQS
jgi:hypothetical protein